MIKKIILVLFIILSCNVEDKYENNPNLITNTEGWSVVKFESNGKSQDYFVKYKFEFYDNEINGCPPNMDGKSPLGVFGGYYKIGILNNVLYFEIIQANVFNLDKIIGVWEIVVINDKTIYLKRLNNKDRQDIIFSRN